MFDAFYAIIISFLIALIIGMPVIKYLAKLKFGQKILEIGPKWHMNKQYTPTMGGFIFIVAIIATSILLGYIINLEFLSMLLFALGFGVIGFIDDYTKVVKKQNEGLTPKQKLILQISLAVLFVSVLRYLNLISSNVYIPFFNVSIVIPWVIFLVFSVFVVVGCTNAVNLTDGIDGLASSVTIPVCIFFMLVSLNIGKTSIAVFSATLIGAVFGFLMFNKNPAKVFMGDTGSLFLGGAVVAMALALDLPLILIPVGIIYICEAVSVILQVGYFKISKGKRLFKMAPIHHHFEMCGFSEKKIVFIFTSITVIFCVIAYMWGILI
ncbi:MAG: phospho-N-acetylmuramoyl-pentapeptide-transferase [Clostridia bacterium]